jgi:hypothetical protein
MKSLESVFFVLCPAFTVISFAGAVWVTIRHRGDPAWTPKQLNRLNAAFRLHITVRQYKVWLWFNTVVLATTIFWFPELVASLRGH